MNLATLTFKYLENNKDFWYCIKCIPQIFPFCTNEINQANIKYLSKPKPVLLTLINQLNTGLDKSRTFVFVLESLF